MSPRRAVAALALALALAACRGRPAAPPPSAVRVLLEAEPPHLNPLLAGDALVLQVAHGDVYEPLYAADPTTGELEPALATAWARSADDREWTFTLRRDARWHDGRPFDARDVAFTFGLLRAPALLAADFDDVEAVETPDPYTVKVRFAAFRLGRDRSLALLPILPAHVFGGGGELLTHAATRAPVGTGAYAFEEWVPGREIRLRRAAGWWGGTATVERVSYRIVPDRTQAVAQLRAGEVDVVLRVPVGPALDELGADARFQLVPYDAPYYLAAVWNCRTGPLADARVRRALTMTLDRETVVREIWRGRARVASAPWEPDDAAYDPAVTPWPYDPAAARALLAEAGAAGLKVQLLVPRGSATLERVATIWREDAARAGVELQVEPDATVIERGRRGEFQGLAFGWTTEPEQDLYGALHSSQIGAENYGGFADAEVDRLLAAIRATPERSARVALEHQLHRRLHELEPMTVIAVDARTAVAAKRVSGVRPGPWGAPARLMSIAGR